jgi:hypothetical protein
MAPVLELRLNLAGRPSKQSTMLLLAGFASMLSRTRKNPRCLPISELLLLARLDYCWSCLVHSPYLFFAPCNVLLAQGQMINSSR